jgi:hypothetical protein
VSVESAPVSSDPPQPATIQATAQPAALPVDHLDVGPPPPAPLGRLTAKLWRLESEPLDADHRFGVQVLLNLQEYLLEIQAQDKIGNFLDLSLEQIVELVRAGR